MKQIGIMRTVGDEWHTATHGVEIPNTKPIFIIEPDDRPINPLQWDPIGWIYPGDGSANRLGGKIYTEKQGSNSVAAYVKRETPPQPEPFATRGEIDEMREVIAGLSEHIRRLEQRADNTAKIYEALAERIGRLEERHIREVIPKPDAMTFYDYAFIAAYTMQGYDKSISDAHALATHLTAARRPA